MNPMLKNAANLSADNEYFIVWAGETNARPWGAKSDGYAMFPGLELSQDGLTLTADLTGGGHTDAAEDQVLFTSLVPVEANEWSGATIRVGSRDSGVIGYGIIKAHAATLAPSLSFFAAMTWTIGSGSAGATEPCYFVEIGRKWSSYPQVRILTPYQAVAGGAFAVDVRPSTLDGFVDGGRSITLPAPYDGATTATSFDDVGTLLPFSFYEGIDGFGISEVNDSEAGTTTHIITGVAGMVWTFGNAIGANDLLNLGRVIVDWETGGVMQRSWAPIVDSTTTTFTVGTWLGDGDPGSDGIGSRYTAWVPYFNDSPYAYLPGEGYTYPNHDMMPCGTSTMGAQTHNRPRGVTGNAYGDTFGALLAAAMKLSASTGRRINVVNLGVTDATLAPSTSRNPHGFGGHLGWWDQDDHATWNPADASSLYARLDKLLRTVLPNAMLAEANTKPLKCLGVVFAHGETDAVAVNSRQTYARAQRFFVDSLRRLLTELGRNPYENGAKIPFVQPRIPVLPYGVDGSYPRDTDRGGGTQTYDADRTGIVNSAIEESSTTDEFAETVRVDDLPRLTSDPGIYSGAGEAALGARIGDTLAHLIDHALGYGSTVLDEAQSRVVDICNMALSHMGDAGQITSLSDGSEQARLCRRFLPEARDELLQNSQWGFALRRRQLVPIQMTEAAVYQNRKHCYVIPAEALFSFKVLGPHNEILMGDFDFTEVTTATYAAEFIENDGSSVTPQDTTPMPLGSNPASSTGGGGVVMGASKLLPLVNDREIHHQRRRPFTVEQSPNGSRYLFTDQDQATLQYVARVVDADLYPPLFSSALSANLGSKLASVLIKGKEGEVVSMRLLQKMAQYVGAAAANDANQQMPDEGKGPFDFVPDSISARNRYFNRGLGGRDPLNHFPTSFDIL